MSSPTSKYTAPPGELPFTAKEETIIDDLNIHHDTISQIQTMGCLYFICKLSQELNDPSTNPPDVPEQQEVHQMGDDIVFLQPTPGQDAINSTLEAISKILDTKKPAPTSNEPSTSQVTEPLTPGLTSTAGQAIPNLQARRRGSNQKPTPTCFAGLTPEIQRPSFTSTIQGIPQSTLAETLRTLQGIPWVSPELEDNPTGSNSKDPRPPKEGS
jgi:hypothetical protein